MENIWKIQTIVLYFVIKENLEISFQNGPEHETTSLISLPQSTVGVRASSVTRGGVIRNFSNTFDCKACTIKLTVPAQKKFLARKIIFAFRTIIFDQLSTKIDPSVKNNVLYDKIYRGKY